MLEMKSWKHVFKLDPDKSISDEALEAICESGSDAVIVGGTYGVTFDKTIDLLARIRRYAIPCLLEISNQEAIVPGFDHYLVPIVLNAMNPNWILKPHHIAVQEFGTMIPWHEISTVGYTVLNPESSVAQLTESETELNEDEIIAYARLSHHLLKSSYFYLEYSGTLGDPQKLSGVYERLKREGSLHIFYGGGITSKEQAEEMSKIADTIVVGNLIYKDLDTAIRTVPK
ncbi:heptaprenylglyceryl phosphate synthase [Caldalkalibacillus mannanilyticus]|uniref:heptaprenylglyceryl phosphate synthase n=1 Tax=Caldalkalibacillus mannanilyticus TaxID=1418 RepID=UPI000552A058|nr:heptaprenylglyceryl phosphate synthase [Caldalkalibacillus mannanilyticus]